MNLTWKGDLNRLPDGHRLFTLSGGIPAPLASDPRVPSTPDRCIAITAHSGPPPTTAYSFSGLLMLDFTRPLRVDSIPVFIPTQGIGHSEINTPTLGSVVFVLAERFDWVIETNIEARYTVQRHV